MKALLTEYNAKGEKTFEDILSFYLTDTCLTAQDKYKSYLNYFRIEGYDGKYTRAYM